MMWFLLLLVLFNANIEPLKVHAKKVILKSKPDKPCEGHIEIFHNNQWGYVGHTIWNNSIEKVVCESTLCGQPNSSGIELRPNNSKVWLNEVSCKGTEKDLSECDFPDWDLNNFRDDIVKTIKCSNKVELMLEGSHCAGAVKYSINGDEGYFCSDNFGTDEANLLCRHLKCGESKKIPKHAWFVAKEFQSSKKMKIMCHNTAHLTHLWQCVDQETRTCQKPASVICEGYERVQLKPNGSNVCSGLMEKKETNNWTPVKNNKTSANVRCQQMHCGNMKKLDKNEVNVTCSENVTVVLTDNNNKESHCYGTVEVKVNNVTRPVCASTWTKEDAQVVCSEKNCGSVVHHKPIYGAVQGCMDNVECLGSESSLWHCFGTRKDNLASQCSSKAFVVCSDSIGVRLVDSPGRCAGRVEIQNEGIWKKVNKKGWEEANSDVVCNSLKCGKARLDSNAEDKYSQGSGDFLAVTVKCEPKDLNISKCITYTNPGDKGAQQKEAVSITCEKHKVVFLDGNNNCSGMVGIEEGSKTFWLSGSNGAWNKTAADTVCRQMQCDEALTFSSTSNAEMKKEVWNESYSCMSNSKSLFECEETAKPLNHNDTVATVICKGNKNVTLTEQCWGNVTICMGDECGAVCDDTWTLKKSEMLCDNLGCGKAIPNAKNSVERESIKASFKSVHTTNLMKDISQSHFIKNDGTSCKAASVVCSKSVVARLNARDECCGNLELFYDGQWLPVCKTALQKTETRNIICGDCGQAVKMHEFFGPKTTSPSISSITCHEGAKSLKDCNITSDTTTCDLTNLECSRCRKMELKTTDKACSGALIVYSGEKRSAVSVAGWTDTEGTRLCKDLNCGNFTSKNPGKIVTDSFWNANFTCEGVNDPKSIWACEKQTQLTELDQLFIKCQDEPQISLSEDCGGEVRINNIRVCDTQWKMEYSDLVCAEKGCTKSVGNSSDKVPDSAVYHHVRCESYHSKLGQCKRFNATCDGGLVSVYCVKKVQFNTSEKCGGEILVSYRNDTIPKWENVCYPEPLSKECEKKMCETLQCGNATIEEPQTRKQENIQKKKNAVTGSPGIVLKCNSVDKVPKNIQVCVRQGSCPNSKNAEIFCEGYKYVPPKTFPTVPVILVVVVLLVLVAVAIVCIRIYKGRKDKRTSNVTSRMLSKNEVEFESGDYEDVNMKANEMEDLSQFRPQAEIPTEDDAHSVPSLPYDDVDELEAQPLTSQAAFAVDSGDNLHFEDQVAYEVDDPQESYDDVESSPQITQTKADLHCSPWTAPEGIPAEPARLPKEDEDYLVPGQDG